MAHRITRKTSASEPLAVGLTETDLTAEIGPTFGHTVKQGRDMARVRGSDRGGSRGGSGVGRGVGRGGRGAGRGRGRGGSGSVLSRGGSAGGSGGASRGGRRGGGRVKKPARPAATPVDSKRTTRSQTKKNDPEIEDDDDDEDDDEIAVKPKSKTKPKAEGRKKGGELETVREEDEEEDEEIVVKPKGKTKPKTKGKRKLEELEVVPEQDEEDPGVEEPEYDVDDGENDGEPAVAPSAIPLPVSAFTPINRTPAPLAIPPLPAAVPGPTAGAAAPRPPGPIPAARFDRSEMIGQRAQVDLEQRKIYMEALEHYWPEEGYWGSSQHLGSGAHGSAYIIQHMDANENITDRKVVKNVFPPKFHWREPQFWYGDVQNLATRIPMEIRVMQTIRRMPGSDKCVELIHAQRNDDGKFYRLYMEWCPFGDLNMLITTMSEADVQKFYDDHSDDENAEPPQGHDERPIPEPAIWSFFADLVDACLLFEHGGVELVDARPGWERIVHRDMKLENVFLGYPNSDRFPSYPKLKLGDFGIAIMTSDNDPMNPRGYNDSEGTRDWMPQEMVAWEDRTNGYPLEGDKLTAKCNVWGIGAILIRLMNQQNGSYTTAEAAEHEAPDRTYTTANRMAPSFLPNARDFYSSRLRTLCNWCVRFSPDDRPELRDLKQRIDWFTTPGQDDQTSGLRERQIGNEDADMELSYSNKTDVTNALMRATVEYKHP